MRLSSPSMRASGVLTFTLSSMTYQGPVPADMKISQEAESRMPMSVDGPAAATSSPSRSNATIGGRRQSPRQDRKDDRHDDQNAHDGFVGSGRREDNSREYAAISPQTVARAPPIRRRQSLEAKHRAPFARPASGNFRKDRTGIVITKRNRVQKNQSVSSKLTARNPELRPLTSGLCTRAPAHAIVARPQPFGVRMMAAKSSAQTPASPPTPL